MEHERRNHFDEIAVLYDRIRPDYPHKLLADVLQYAGLDAGASVLEIGAGTGKATSFFLNAGYCVAAVEPGVNMAEILRKRFCGNAGFSVINENFEDISINNGSCNLIYAATAFHWVDANVGCPKAFQLLKQGGAFAVFRYNVAQKKGTGLHKDIQAVYENYFAKQEESEQNLWNSSETKKAFGFEGLQQYGFIDIAMKSYTSSQTFNSDEYVAMLRTFPDHESLPPADRVTFYKGIKEAIAKHGGAIEVGYLFRLYMGRKP